MINIALLSGHSLSSEGIRLVLESFGTYNVPIQATSTNHLIDTLTNSATLPDLCIIGSQPENINAHTTLQQLKKLWPSLKVLVLTAARNSLALMFMIKFGADGFINIGCQKEHFKEAVENVCNGCTCYPDDLMQELGTLQKKRKRIKSICIFSDKEYTVMILLFKQYMRKEIAHILNVAIGTIDTHITRIYHKLSVKNNKQLMVHLQNAGFGALEL